VRSRVICAYPQVPCRSATSWKSNHRCCRPSLAVLCGQSRRDASQRAGSADASCYRAERYLKRLVVGGFDGCSRSTRNFLKRKASSTRHNPEFTMLEFLSGYADTKTTWTLDRRNYFRRWPWDVLGQHPVWPTRQSCSTSASPFAGLSVFDSILQVLPLTVSAARTMQDLDAARRLPRKPGPM